MKEQDRCLHHAHECECGAHECECGAHVEDPEACHQRPGTSPFEKQDPNKGVSLGVETEEELGRVMSKRYGRFLREGERFHVTTEVCHHFGLVSAVLTSEDRESYVTVEVSVECEPNQIENPMDAYREAVDAMDLVWLDYFDSDRISHYLPIWQSYELEGKHINVRFDHCNPALDDAASAFLREHGFLEGGLRPEDYDDEA